MVSERAEHEPQAQIRYWFFVRHVPYGQSPEEIRAGMINIPMPVRQPRPVEGPQPYLASETNDATAIHRVPDGVFVSWSDGVKALRLFGQDVSATWLENYLANNPNSNGMVFDRTEGEIVPTDLAARLMPGLEEFDLL